MMYLIQYNGVVGSIKDKDGLDKHLSFAKRKEIESYIVGVWKIKLKETFLTELHKNGLKPVFKARVIESTLNVQAT